MRYWIKIISIFILLTGSLNGYSQFNLSGQVINYSGNENLKINIPMVFGFYRENSIPIPIKKDGTFSILLPIEQARFGNLIFQRKFLTMLLDTRKNLSLVLNAADTSFKLTSGTALAENKVMQMVEVEEYPSFFKEPDQLAKLTYQQIQEEIVKPYLAQRDEKIKKVKNAAISSTYKALITDELKSIAYNYLYDLSRTGLATRAMASKLVIDIYDASNPSPTIIPAGPQFYAYIDNYVRYLEIKAFLKIAEEKIPSNQPIPYYGISLDSANIFIKKYSKPQWRFLGALKNLPLNVVEDYAYQLIIKAIQDNELRQSIDLTAQFSLLFPSSRHLAPINTHIDQLKSVLAKNERNANITVLANYEQTNSIYEVIKSLKGKVVYLDVWGTWCGPCKEELKYIPDLKTKFNHKDVAYVYLDLDDDSLDAQWREFIKVNNMEGLHLRKNRQTIVPFWKELLANANDKAEYYPQYFIFDKEGKLVVSKAKRPSEKEELYAQIEEFLK